MRLIEIAEAIKEIESKIRHENIVTMTVRESNFIIESRIKCSKRSETGHFSRWFSCEELQRMDSINDTTISFSDSANEEFQKLCPAYGDVEKCCHSSD